MTVPCPGARTKRQGQRETIAAGGEDGANIVESVIRSGRPVSRIGTSGHREGLSVLKPADIGEPLDVAVPTEAMDRDEVT